MDITPYRLEDDAFWTTQDRGSDRMAQDLVGKYEGLLIDAPRRVPIDQRATLPAAVYQLGTIRDVSTLRFKALGLVTAMNVTENRLHVTTARAFDKDDDSIKAPARDPARLPKGNMSATESMELRAGLSIPWQPSRYLLTALLRDQVSNRAQVELCQSPACYVDPEVVKYLEAERAKLNPPEISPRPGEPLPSYRRLADSLPVPEQPGIQLAASRVYDERLAQPWILRGAFKLSPSPQEWVKSGWADPISAARPAEARPVAVVTVWLLLAGADDGSAHVFPLRVPSWSRVDARTCTGQFSIDLRQLRGAPRTPQTYFIYAFSGESMAGPVPAALVGAR